MSHVHESTTSSSSSAAAEHPVPAPAPSDPHPCSKLEAIHTYILHFFRQQQQQHRGGGGAEDPRGPRAESSPATGDITVRGVLACVDIDETLIFNIQTAVMMMQECPAAPSSDDDPERGLRTVGELQELMTSGGKKYATTRIKAVQFLDQLQRELGPENVLLITARSSEAATVTKQQLSECGFPSEQLNILFANKQPKGLFVKQWLEQNGRLAECRGIVAIDDMTGEYFLDSYPLAFPEMRDKILLLKFLTYGTF
ncbi:hypothetical protein Pelo_2844 [Pelomyxa schiedti]|nr:hypothetical protein Pelo_2844 [Pelomyxa schiedti]